jgi:hypothetical protein
MRFTRLQQIIACLIVFVLPSMLLMGETAAVMTPHGQVWLNAAAVSQTSALVPGDRVTTGAQSSAALSAKGATVLLNADSAVVLQKDSFQVDGNAVFNLGPGMVARVADLTIYSAVNGPSRFEVRQGGSSVQVADHTGSVLVQRNGKVTKLTAGQTMSFGPKDSAVTGGGGSSLSNGAIAGIVGGIAALSAIIAAISTRSNETAASPFAP